MIRRAFVVACLTLSLIAQKKTAVSAQEPTKEEKSEEVEKSKKMASDQKMKKRAAAKDTDQDTSVALPQNVAQLGERFLLDQKQMWTSPGRLRWSDANWLLPLSGVAAGLFVTDVDMSRHTSHSLTTTNHYNTISTAGVAGLIGGGAAMWLLSYPKRNQHWRETGFLAGEAAVNSLVAVESLKYSLGRQRPMQGNGNGDFFSRGVSFPSEHSAVAWAVASVVAHEYPGPFTKLVVYGLAGLVDYSRFRARQHFPSDVFIGSIVGNLVAEGVYNRHHDVELGGSTWEPLRNLLRQRHATSSANMGSPYVPLDSWVYPAMDRLIAQGFIQSAMVDMRPWTRFECARLVAEAGERLDNEDVGTSAVDKIYASLAQEFGEERELLDGGDNTRARVESISTRITEISGKPLAQGYHFDFGQTVINDFGRPYEQGFNNVTGFSGWATESYFTVYASGEFQHAPAAPPLTASAREVIGNTQFVPPPPATPIDQIDRFELQNTYVGMTFNNWEVTFGKQSLWWGPGAGGSMIISDNAPPINMFRISRVSPFKLPSVLRFFGPMRLELFLGQLSGQNFAFKLGPGLIGSWTSTLSPQPMISGERISFKPTPNVEFGFSATTLFAGEGVPFTTHTYLNSIIKAGVNGLPGSPQDPGDRRSGFDLSYRLPLLRNWATFYADGFADDQLTPVAYWDRSAWTGGLYLSHLPKASKLDLRVEGVFSDVPAGGAIGRGFFYWNDRYVNGYTNQGNLIGSWIGRDGQGAQVWSNYWLTPKNRIQLNFRHQKVSQQFIPGGGSLTDVGVQGDYALRKTLDLSLSVQYERWLIPAIQPQTSRNVTTSLTLRFEPGRSISLAHLKSSRADDSIEAGNRAGRP
jgi:membrane-associated phospholipid phosphatase